MTKVRMYAIILAMRTFSYVDPDGEHTITDEQIIKEYFPWWSNNMCRIGKDDMISHERCIQDFCTVHWAFEIELGDNNEQS